MTRNLTNNKEASRKKSLGELGELFALKALVDNKFDLINLSKFLSWYSVMEKKKKKKAKVKGTLDKILEKDPLWLADDDHPERNDISLEEFSQGLKELIKKHKLKDKSEKELNKPPSEFSKGIIDALNSLPKSS